MSALPAVNPFMVAAIQAFLLSTFGMHKPPSANAALLAFIVELHLLGLPFPLRQDVADHARCDLASVDRGLSVSLARGLIRMEMRTVPGNVKQRPSTRRLRFYIPSAELLAVAAPFR